VSRLLQGLLFILFFGCKLHGVSLFVFFFDLAIFKLVVFSFSFLWCVVFLEW
jgi:hypothetical protein